jgi:hypothetical protein
MILTEIHVGRFNTLSRSRASHVNAAEIQCIFAKWTCTATRSWVLAISEVACGEQLVIGPTVGEHRRWSQNGHHNLATLLS